MRDFANVKTAGSLIAKAVRYYRADVVLLEWHEALPDDVRCDVRGVAFVVGEIWFMFQDGSETLLCVSVWGYVRALASRNSPAVEVMMQEHPVLVRAQDLIQPCIHRRSGGLCAVLLPRTPPFL